MFWKVFLSLIMALGLAPGRAQVAGFAPGSAFLVTGVGAGGAVSAVALGVAAAPLAGLTAVVVAGYTLYVTHDQYRALLESGQLDKWQREGLNADLKTLELPPQAEQMCRVQTGSSIGPSGLAYRRCVIGAADSYAAAQGRPTSADLMELIEPVPYVHTRVGPDTPCPDDPNEPVTDADDNAIRALYQRNNHIRVGAQDLHQLALELGWEITVKTGKGVVEYRDSRGQMRLAMKPALGPHEGGANSRRDRFEVRNSDGNRYDLRTGACLPERAPPGPEGDIWASKTHPELANLRLLLEELKTPVVRGISRTGGVR